MDELTLEPGFLRMLILNVRALMAQEDADIDDEGGNASDDEVAAMLQDDPDNLTREEIKEEIDGLSPDESNQLVALMWLGRGDGDAEDWEELIQTAREREFLADSEYLLGEPLLADYWAEGLEKLGHGSSVLERGEY